MKRQQTAISERNAVVTVGTTERDEAIAQLGITTAALSPNITTRVGMLDARSLDAQSLDAIIDAIGARLQALDPSRIPSLSPRWCPGRQFYVEPRGFCVGG